MAISEKEIFLICQDDEINWKITKRLVDKDYTISTSHSVADGLGMVYETPPALIVRLATRPSTLRHRCGRNR